MSRIRSYLVLILGVALISAGVFLLGAQPTLSQEEPDPLGEPGTFLTDYYDAWVNSPHANYEDDAFRHWDEDGEISESCATCHSTPGYLDFLGADGTAAGVVDAPAPLGTVVNCTACHNDATDQLTTITFPSGAEIGDLEDSSRCMVCHQGRESGSSLTVAIEEAGLTGEPNTVSEELGFINIHYYAAAASIYGSEVMGGFQYEGERYHMRNEHAEGYSTCAGCHDPHSLELDVADCATCHEGVETVEDLRTIRSFGSSVDYDGDGDMEEGIAEEISTLQELLYSAIQIYASEIAGTPIIYAEAYPYFFIDTDGDGAETEGEANFGNRYNAFTSVLLQATYNYQVSQKDPGGYTHNPDYHIQLLFDSITSINAQFEDGAVDVSGGSRDSFGHFASSAEAFRHWDEDGEVSARCSTCHTSEGLPFFLEHGVSIAFEPSNALSCTTCHNDVAEGTLYPVESVVFPSGAEVTFGEESASTMCLSCHQGRDSGVGIAQAISSAGVDDDTPSDALRFRNPHYFATGSALFGSVTNGAFQYEDMEYNGQFEHTRRFNECSDCHMPHASTIRFAECIDCHEEVETLADVNLIRAHPDDKDRVDYDGDGDDDEPIAAEIETFVTDLYDQIFVYAADTIGTPIANGPGYPYWFVDTNGNGEVDPDEASRDNAYNQWTPTLLRAIYNYQFFTSGTGTFSHNPDYALQVLYDTLADIGGEEAVANYTRPEVRTEDD